jgi:pyridoxal phosphate enzyme (YggS family)
LIDPVEVAERVHVVRSSIEKAGGVGVALIAVTKTFGVEAIFAARDAGCDGVGENYAQELLAKIEEGIPPIDVHFIGAVQSNKVRQLAGHVSLWQSIDRESLIVELGKRAPGARILLQVDTTGEPTKGGVDPSGLDALVQSAQTVGVQVDGLMTIGPTSGDRDECVKAFSLLRSLVDTYGLRTCSMGMSDDYELAVSCGSTMVRVGSRLFGTRPFLAH